MRIHVLYPESPLRRNQPDEQFSGEVEAMRGAGFETELFSFEDLQAGHFGARTVLPMGARVLYRGWMLSPSEYEAMLVGLAAVEARVVIPLREYLANHYLPNWYPKIKDLTPETRIFGLDCDLESELRRLDWPEYFIKDYVKSLKTSIGSRISRPEQVAAVVGEMRRFRGVIEGGFCVRRVEALLPETERRYFVVEGVPHAASGEVPPIVHECTERLSSRFYSVDVAERSDGQPRVVEVGDGQVSDLVGWTAKGFASILAQYFEEE